MPAVKLTYNNTDYENEIVAEGGRIEMTHAMAGESLSADSLTVPITTGGQPIRLLAADQEDNDLLISDDNEILCLDSGVSAPEYIKNSPGLLYYGNDLLVKHYLHQINRRSKYEYEMVFYSAVWLLDQSDHVGGLYTGETAETVLSDILSNIVTYSIDDDIKDIRIYGYLPYDKRRNNLMKVLMAIGAALKNASDGSLRITQLSDVVAGIFDGERVYLGGTVSDSSPATAVQVTEHNYLPSEEEVTLFDDSTIGTETVIFNEPYHDLLCEGGTIVSSGVNYCTFTATGYVTLKGKRYNHVTRIITVGEVPTGTESDTVRKVTDNTLITPLNSVFIAEKIYNYLTKSQIIKQDVIVGTERPGDVVSVLNPYTQEMVEACIKSMAIQFGKSRLKATCEFLVGYKPPGATTGFTNYIVLTGSGTWTVPEGVTRIRIILCGAGQNGENGKPGTNNIVTVGQTGNSTGQPGGAGGQKGLSGRIFEINVNVTPEDEISYSCGEENDEATVFGSYSSEVGRRYTYGFTDPLSGLTIGGDGIDGVAGGKGTNFPNGYGPPVTFNGQTWYPTAIDDYWAASGGPAVGSNATTRHGANATIPGADGENYGEGGSGGHGGGGAGGMRPETFVSGAWISGGAGSPGGKGGPGCIIVYY